MAPPGWDHRHVLWQMRWTFVRDVAGDWLVRRYPPADANLLRAIETFAFELRSLDRLEMFIDHWVSGAAIDPGFRSGTEAVRLELVDSSVVRLIDMHGQFENTSMSRTDFRAMLDGFLRGMTEL
jgi:hypothetical protein